MPNSYLVLKTDLIKEEMRGKLHLIYLCRLQYNLDSQSKIILGVNDYE